MNKRRLAKHLYRLLRYSTVFHHFRYQRVVVYPGESYSWLKARAMWVAGVWDDQTAQRWHEEQATLADDRYWKQHKEEMDEQSQN